MCKQQALKLTFILAILITIILAMSCNKKDKHQEMEQNLEKIRDRRDQAEFEWMRHQKPHLKPLH